MSDSFIPLLYITANSVWGRDWNAFSLDQKPNVSTTFAKRILPWQNLLHLFPKPMAAHPWSLWSFHADSLATWLSFKDTSLSWLWWCSKSWSELTWVSSLPHCFSCSRSSADPYQLRTLTRSPWGSLLGSCWGWLWICVALWKIGSCQPQVFLHHRGLSIHLFTLLKQYFKIIFSILDLGVFY
jgi:hypothetical protein